MKVSRTEVAELIGHAMTSPRSSAEILDVAVAAGARPAVIDLLGGLRPRSYSGLRSLWAELPDLPVDA